jgi:fatty-acyl-CoA synthase
MRGSNNQLLNFGEIVAMNAYVSPDKVGARDLTRSWTFRGWNDRSCKLANALVGLGLERADRIAVLAYTCLEWMEIWSPRRGSSLCRSISGYSAAT